MVGDLVPHWLWESTLRDSAGGVALLPVWALVTVVWWTVLGFGLGVALSALGPLGRPFLLPLQSLIAGACRLAGMRRPAEFFAPL